MNDPTPTDTRPHPDELERRLTEALYATNSVIQPMNDICPIEDRDNRETYDFKTLEEGRDHIWKMIQTINPDRKD